MDHSNPKWYALLEGVTFGVMALYGNETKKNVFSIRYPVSVLCLTTHYGLCESKPSRLIGLQTSGMKRGAMEGRVRKAVLIHTHCLVNFAGGGWIPFDQYLVNASLFFGVTYYCW